MLFLTSAVSYDAYQLTFYGKPTNLTLSFAYQLVFASNSYHWTPVLQAVIRFYVTELLIHKKQVLKFSPKWIVSMDQKYSHWITLYLPNYLLTLPPSNGQSLFTFKVIQYHSGPECSVCLLGTIYNLSGITHGISPTFVSALQLLIPRGP